MQFEIKCFCHFDWSEAEEKSLLDNYSIDYVTKGFLDKLEMTMEVQSHKNIKYGKYIKKDCIERNAL